MKNPINISEIDIIGVAVKNGQVLMEEHLESLEGGINSAIKAINEQIAKGDLALTEDEIKTICENL